MNNFIIYSIEIAISLALFYIAYWVFLKNETFFKLNRFYIIFSVIISLSTPLINITVGEDSFIARNLILPIEQYEQSLGINLDNKYYPKKNRMITTRNREFDKNNLVTEVDHATNKSNSAQPFPTNSSENSSSGKKINWLTIVLTVYLIGAGLFFLRFLANFIWIFSYIVKHKQQHILGMKIIRFEKNISPFSFLNFIFISNKEYSESELNKIISHEKVHIKQKHTLDLILFELLLVIQWFNPFIWLYKNAIKITHEYLADQGVINSGVDLPSYQYSLLNQVLRENNFEIASSYNFSVKKRISMMMKKKSSKLSTVKLIIPVPILIFLFGAFAFCTSPSEKDVKHNEVNSSILDSDTSIKRIDVPIEYLKLLEGEYNSTNQMRNQKRRIVFTEALGTLYGFDNGYSYKIIPVGDGKFINPEDHASLVFDTNNKNAIKMLLFDKIHLNKAKIEKGKIADKSMAFTLLNIMVKEGIPAALSYYKVVKDSSNYFLTENDMNLAAYALFESKKIKEASAMCKLNIEINPNSFNVYDSYAEALLLLGDKAQAMENFKKSVKLNPGSVNGIKRLKELGVNTDSLIKIVKVPIEYLKLLEGQYVSTNEPNWVRRILFTVADGELHGWDNGYAYKIIPMGDGKFINPDDGASLVFDTKNKNSISMLLFGKINLNKTEWKESGINLKKDSIKLEKEILLKYSGEYINEGLQHLAINLKDENLYRHMYTGIRDERLIPISNTKFVYADFSGRTMDFTLAKDGEVIGLTITDMNRKITYTKNK